MKMGYGLLVGVIVVAASIWGWRAMTQGETLTAQKLESLPWQSTITPQGFTKVFGVEVGQVTLRQLIEQLHSFPELGVFETPKGERSLEAYFGKQRLGLFEAKLVAELVSDHAQLARFVETSPERKPQPTGTWRFELSEPSVREANEQRVRYLVYMPVVNYESDVIEARFGLPAEIIKTHEQLSWWLYPEKGLIIMQDQQGGDVFYYSAPSDYAALKERAKTSLPNE